MLVLSLPYLILYLDLSNHVPFLKPGLGGGMGPPGPNPFIVPYAIQTMCLYILYSPCPSLGSWGPAMAHALRQAWQMLMFPLFRKNRGSPSFPEVASNSRGHFVEVEEGCWESWRNTHNENISCMWHLKYTQCPKSHCRRMFRIDRRYKVRRRNTIQTGLDGRREWELPKNTNTSLKCFKWRHCLCINTQSHLPEVFKYECNSGMFQQMVWERKL